MANPLFELIAKLTLDISGYDKGIEEASGKTSSFGDKLKSGLATAAKVGAAAVGAATTAVAAFAKSSIDAGSQFDAAMSQVAAISGATGSDFDALREKAMEMGSKTKFSATESAEAFNYMAMAGWKTEDMLGGIEGIMNLAAASGEDLATTSDIVTDALTAFGLSASDSSHFADVLAVASSNANTNVSMMGETFKYVAPVAGSLGYSAEDVAEAIGLMANSGIKASQAGTALRSIISRLSTDAGASSEKLGALGTLTEELGVQFFEADGTARNFGDVLAEARVAWANLTEEEQINYGNTIAGMEGMSAWMALMNASTSDISKLEGALANADGAALQMANTMQDNLAGDITIFKSAMEGLQIQLSDKLTPILRDVIQRVTEFVSNFDVDAAIESIKNLINTFKDFSPVIAGATSAVLAYKAATAISGIIDALRAATEGQTIAQAALNAVMNANPFVLIATLIAAVVTALITLWNTNEDFRNAVKNIWEGIKNVFTGAWDAIKGAWDSVKGFFSNIWDGIKNTFAGVRDWFGEKFTAAKEAASNAWSTIKGAFEQRKNEIQSVFSTIGNWFGEKFSGAREAITNAFSGIRDFFQNVFNNITGVFSNVWNTFMNIGSDIVNGIANGISGAWEDFTNWVSGMFNDLVGGIKNLLGIHSPSKVFAGIGENMAKGLGKGWDSSYDKIADEIDDDMNFSGSIDTSGSSSYGAVGSGSYTGSTINITVNGANIQNDQELAERISFELQMLMDRRSAAFGT